MVDDAITATFRELARRYEAASAVGDYEERAMLYPLVDAADNLARAADTTAGLHYRVDRTGDLLWAALRASRAGLLAYAGQAAVAQPDGHARDIADAAALLDTICRHVRRVMWVAAHRARGDAGDVLTEAQCQELRAVARSFAEWVDRATGEKPAL